jgi:hypothetical protein
MRRSRLALLTLLAAVAVFCVVQDRGTAAGARRYVALQRDAIAGRGAPVTIDGVMRPAIADSVRRGLGWGAAVMMAGVAVTAVAGRRG